MVGKNFKFQDFAEFQDFASRLGGDFGDDNLESFGYLACQRLPDTNKINRKNIVPSERHGALHPRG